MTMDDLRIQSVREVLDDHLNIASRWDDVPILHITERGVVVDETFGTSLDELRARIDVPLLPRER